MNRASRELFSSPKLSELRPGELTLGVPTFRDILQINHVFTIDAGIARLALTRTATDLTIVRDDEHDIQAWINGYDFNQEDYSQAYHYSQTVEVFVRPVPVVKLVQEAEHLWRLAPNTAQAQHVARVKKFAATIGKYGLEKQEKADKQADLRSEPGV